MNISGKRVMAIMTVICSRCQLFFFAVKWVYTHAIMQGLGRFCNRQSIYRANTMKTLKNNNDTFELSNLGRLFKDFTMNSLHFFNLTLSIESENPSINCTRCYTNLYRNFYHERKEEVGNDKSWYLNTKVFGCRNGSIYRRIFLDTVITFNYEILEILIV